MRDGPDDVPGLCMSCPSRGYACSIRVLRGSGGDMDRVGCPSWCAEDVTDATGVQHRLLVGDVRLTRVNAPGARRTMCAIRRRPERTPAQVAQLCEDLAAAGHVLRREQRRRRVVLQANFAVQDAVAGRVGDASPDRAAASPV